MFTAGLQRINLPPNFFAVASACSNFLSVAITVAPSWANLIAAALPIPPPEPKYGKFRRYKKIANLNLKRITANYIILL